MSSSITKYLERPLVRRHSELRERVIILGNSKVRYLKEQISSFPEFKNHISFISRPGTTFSYWKKWFYSNFHHEVNLYGNIRVFIFIGACDLTQKKGKYINLRHVSQETAVSNLINDINILRNYIDRFPSVIPVFLEIPAYSIGQWNKTKGHPNFSQFIEQDQELHKRIKKVNEHIISVNARLGVSSPRFTSDLLKYRGGRKEKKTRITYNFKLYKDGIHPTPLLARCWLKRILSTFV